MTSAQPKEYSTVTPSLVCKDAAKTIDTYKKAFGAKELFRMNCPETGKIMHAVIEIGNSKIMLGDEWPGCPASGGASFYVYMPDCDAAMKQAKEAGLQETMPAADMFWGDRLGAVKDENGINWSIATHVKDVSPEELDKGAKEFAKNMKGGGGQKAA
jgi:PhnB protein